MKKLLSVIITSILLGAFVMSGCGSNGQASNLKTVTVAASPVPHAEILNQVKDLMKEKGFNLVVKEFTDYVQPNLAVDTGDCDANFFQHQPYLDDFNAERGTHVVSIGAVHYEPFGVNKGKKRSLSDISTGDKIAVPNDVTNEARALNLLEAAGIIKLKSGVGLKATKLDIVENPNNVEIVELESAQIPRALDSVEYACMNGNYAMQANFKASDSLFLEKQDSEAAKLYANIICVKAGNENADLAKALMECVKNEKVKDFVNKTYDMSVIIVD